MPSFVKRPDVYKWLKEYHNKYGQNLDIKYNCEVVSVVTHDDDKFAITWSESQSAEHETAIFDHVVVATGHFSVPNVPIFPGEEKFNGKIIHSTDFRDGRLFQGKRILLIGGSHSTEDIALQCWKFDAKSTHITLNDIDLILIPNWRLTDSMRIVRVGSPFYSYTLLY